jgi:VWFA-related protein
MKQCFAIRNLAIASTVSVLLASSLGVGRPRQDQDFTIRSDVRLVLLDVSVKDRAGGFVSGLTKPNFTVLENGKPQPITVFANDDVPVTVGILVDESFSMRTKRSEVLTAAQTFIEESNPRDEIFVLNFNDRVTRGLPDRMLFSDDIKQLRAALNRGTPQGKTALNDAIVAGLEQLQLGRRDKKTLIVISDGGDNASEHKRSDMLKMVEESTATIYTIGIYDTNDPDRAPGILKELAGKSGGEAYFPANPAEMVPVCRRIAKDIRTRYTLGYIPVSANGATMRQIRVHVTSPDRGRLVARTRKSYRYEDVKDQAKK